MSGSNIAQIIDYTAAVAGEIEGVKATFGTGTTQTDDPLRPGRTIETAPVGPSSAMTHFSEVPGAPDLKWVTQNGTVELTWNIPMRLWLPKTDSEARRAAIPFYDRYIAAFTRDHRLGGLVLRSHVALLTIGGDKDWSWLNVGLQVVELVNYSA